MTPSHTDPGVRDYVRALDALRRARREVAALDALAGDSAISAMDRQSAEARALVARHRVLRHGLCWRAPSPEVRSVAAALATWLAEQGIEREALDALIKAMNIEQEDI